MSAESRGILWGAGLLAGFTALLLLIGVLAPWAPPAEALRHFDPAYLVRAKAYSRARYLLFLAGQALPVALLVWTIARGWDRALARWLLGLVGPRPVLAAVLIGAIVSVGITAAGLPAGIARFVLDHRYGLSTQTVGLWLADLGKSLLIGLAISSALLAALFAAIRRWPAGWWAAAAAGFALYLALSSFLGPVVIDPLFHRFTPVADAELAAESRQLARRAGVPVREVLVMDASRRTRRVNAYFTGFGATRRIVLYDTLLQSYDRRQVLLVLAHELGHWRLHHIYLGIALGAAGSAGVFWLAQRLLAGAPGRPGDPAHVVVLVLFLTLASFAALPVQNAVSRTFERQADRFALALTGDGPGMAELEKRLARSNLADVAPHPFTVAVLFTHPPVLERIETALAASR
ncbi:M48 family metallopeptidase [Caldinitratiruptor microaerophilus]|uniref:Ste24 endopeptidase n=1 Tax=Caldinitratiruptor microaerophilus TaxID=671077 RepID=A0AA35CQ45_9FIRM|nr:M48 family metallopeptidase [Caldinitratiruptor microaerophilus]BDG62112.1 Ste24 endopeptidase [Caldinitratiruptor microaerophilus]